MLNNQLAIASPSLGQHISHTLPQKISAASHNGFAGIEITHSDLLAYCSSLDITLQEAAAAIRQECSAHNLHILAFAAFENFEGHPSPLEPRMEIAK